MPEWHSKWETEGKTADEVKQLIDRKKIKYVESWGNKSRLGACITDKLDKLYKLEAEQTQKKNKNRHQTIDGPRASHSLISKTPLDINKLPMISRVNKTKQFKQGGSLIGSHRKSAVKYEEE